MKLCLNMIVKNEAARIERCLVSVAPHLSSWCIVDTGSTADTKRIIRDFFAKHKLHGVLGESEFRDFSAARNYALERARIAHLGADYFLLADADMELIVEDAAWAEKLTAPSYKLAQKNTGLFYWNTRLLRADQRSAKYVGVTHEYLSTEGDSPNLTGAWFRDHGDGSNREGKFKRDADLLRADVAEKARSFYYLAQSLRDMGAKRDAAEAYGICTRIARWDEERWSAELNRARCLHDLGAPEWVDVALHAFGQRPTRAEPLYDLARHFREQGLNAVSLLFSEHGLTI